MKLKLRSHKQKCFCEIDSTPLKNGLLSRLRVTKAFNDKIITDTSDTEFHVSSLVISSLSPLLFELMKTPGLKVSLPFSGKVVQHMIDLAYTGYCDITVELLKPLLDLANTYDIRILKKLCADFISSTLSDNNIINFYRLSMQHVCEHLAGKIGRNLRINFSKHVSNVAMGLSKDELLDLVKMEDLHIKDSQLFEFLLEWADQNQISDIESIEDLLTFVSRDRTPATVVLALGGWSICPSDVIEVQDCLTNTWSVCPVVLPVPSAYHGLGVLGGKLYLVGGFTHGERGYLDSLYRLDMDSIEWVELSPMETKRCYVSTVDLDGKLVVLGGHDGANRLTSTEQFDPRTNLWTEMPGLRVPRSDFATVNYCGHLITMGGFSGEEVLSSVEILAPGELWRLTSPLSTPRSGVGAAVLMGRIYVIGGFDGEERLSSVECFTPGLKPGDRTVWHQVPDMLSKRSNFSVTVAEEKIVVAGGYKTGPNMPDSGGGVCRDVEIFCPRENKWSREPSLNIGRSALKSVTIERGSLACQYK